MRKIICIIFFNIILCNQAISVETKYLKKIPAIYDKLLVCKVYYEFINEYDSSNKSYAKIGAYVNELNKYKSFNITIKNVENVFKKLNTYFLNLPTIDGTKIQLNNKYKRTCDKLISNTGVSMPWDTMEAVINTDIKFKDAIRSFDIFADLEGVSYDFTKKSEKNELEENFNSSNTDIPNENSGDVKGKKLFCYWNNEPISGFGVEFNRNNKVKLRALDDENEKLITINGKYQALSNKIVIKYKNLDNSDEDMTINRKTLKIYGSSRSSCEAIAKSSSIEKKLKLALDSLISKKSSENKF